MENKDRQGLEKQHSEKGSHHQRKKKGNGKKGSSGKASAGRLKGFVRNQGSYLGNRAPAGGGSEIETRKKKRAATRKTGGRRPSQCNGNRKTKARWNRGNHATETRQHGDRKRNQKNVPTLKKAARKTGRPLEALGGGETMHWAGFSIKEETQTTKGGGGGGAGRLPRTRFANGQNGARLGVKKHRKEELQPVELLQKETR